MIRLLALLLLAGCTSTAGWSTLPPGWQMPVLGKAQPIVWVIEHPKVIEANMIALGKPAGARAYARWSVIGPRRCIIYTPPLNDVSVMALLRHEVAHCVLGKFHD